MQADTATLTRSLVGNGQLVGGRGLTHQLCTGGHSPQSRVNGILSWSVSRTSPSTEPSKIVTASIRVRELLNSIDAYHCISTAQMDWISKKLFLACLRLSNWPWYCWISSLDNREESISSANWVAEPLQLNTLASLHNFGLNQIPRWIRQKSCWFWSAQELLLLISFGRWFAKAPHDLVLVPF